MSETDCGTEAMEAMAAMAATVALASLPLMGPRRLRQLLDAHGSIEAWASLRSGAPLSVAASETVQQQWRESARSVRPDEVLARHHGVGVDPLIESSEGWPRRLAGDPEPPIVLFAQGRLDPLQQPTVGIVGTRQCTRYGRDVAFELGGALADAGVAVVSGLALGIDAAAHAGARRAGGSPVAVVASGLDRIYPPANAGLWQAVIDHGVVLSEHALGVGVARWAFPARNRIIAALSDVVVVVESPRQGGSMYTVDAALERDRPVFAVPGPIRSAASAGTNQLLADGAFPMTGPGDVLELLGMGGDATVRETTRPETGAGSQPAVLDAIGWEPATVEDVARRCGLSAAEAATQLQFLVSNRSVVQRGAWYERTISPEGLR